jgi:hypothetical protein
MTTLLGVIVVAAVLVNPFVVQSRPMGGKFDDIFNISTSDSKVRSLEEEGWWVGPS